MKSMLSWFGGLLLGIDLPKVAARNSNGPWRGTDMTNISAGGHLVPIIGYDENWFICITWGKIVKIDGEFIKRFTKETYYIVPEQWMRWNAQPGSAHTPDYDMKSNQIADTFTAYCLMERFPVVPWP